jgi:hypothetical protein
MAVFYFKASSVDDLWPVGDDVTPVRFRWTINGDWELYFKSETKAIKTVRGSLDGHTRINIRRMSLRTMNESFNPPVDLDFSIDEEGFGRVLSMSRGIGAILAHSGDGRFMRQVPVHRDQLVGLM